MKEIPLNHGRVAIVDDMDYPWLSTHMWHCCTTKNSSGKLKGIYAGTNIVNGESGYKIIRMHRMIMDCPRGMQVDHINGDGLDNRRCNLRICTNSENQGNQHKIRGSSKFKGVSFYKSTNRWKAQIQKDKKKIAIGYFTSELDAAKAYDAAALRLFGEFACINTYDTDD